MRLLHNMAKQAGIAYSEQLFFKFLGKDGMALRGSVVWKLPTDDVVGDWMPEVDTAGPYYFGDASGLTTWIDERLFIAQVLDARPEDLDYVGTQCRLLFEIKVWKEDQTILLNLPCDSIDHVLDASYIRDSIREGIFDLTQRLRPAFADSNVLDRIDFLKYDDMSDPEKCIFEAVENTIVAAKKRLKKEPFWWNTCSAAILAASYVLSEHPRPPIGEENETVRSEWEWQSNRLVSYFSDELNDKLRWVARLGKSI